jgi:subtilisin family serine protease/PKD repeat protein
MNKIRESCVPLGLLAGLLISAPAFADERTVEVAGTGEFSQDLSGQADRPHLIEGHYIVVVSDQPGRNNPRAAAALEALAKEVGQKPGAKIHRTYKNVLTGFAAELTDKQVDELRRDPRVLSIEQDSYIYLASAGTAQEYPTWGLDRIDQREPLLDWVYAYNTGASGVTAYILDSGIHFTHPEFGGRALLGYDFIREYDAGLTDPTQGPGEDCFGHGTHVAGTVGGRTYGVAKDVALISVRVFGCTGFTHRSLYIAAVDWITQDVQSNGRHPAVVNMSFGFNSASDEVHSVATELALLNSIATGVHYVAAGGNSNTDACHFTPARVAGVLTAGASAMGDQRAWFSNYGDCVDLFAPGAAIVSAFITDDWSGDGSYTRSWNGTSMAAPHVAGVVALYLAEYPQASPAEVFEAIVANATRNAVADVPYGTNSLLYSLWKRVEFTPPSPLARDWNLSANGKKVQGKQVIELRWNPHPDLTATGEIYRDGSIVSYFSAYTGDGFFNDDTGIKGNHGTYVHKVCSSQISRPPSCSEYVTTIFGDGGDGGGGGDPNSPPSADFSYQADKLAVEFIDTSTDSDGTVTGWNWNFGDGNASNAQHPLHTFPVAGTYTVSLTVTDNDGATGSTSKNISVSDDETSPGDFVLTANGRKVRGRIIIDLSWTGATSATVDIYRNGGLIASGITDSGGYRDETGQTGGGTFTHQICEAGTTVVCSNVTSTAL